MRTPFTKDEEYLSTLTKVLLENQRLLNEQAETEPIEAARFKRISIPLIRRIYSVSSFNDPLCPGWPAWLYSEETRLETEPVDWVKEGF